MVLDAGDRLIHVRGSSRLQVVESRRQQDRLGHAIEERIGDRERCVAIRSRVTTEISLIAYVGAFGLKLAVAPVHPHLAFHQQAQLVRPGVEHRTGRSHIDGVVFALPVVPEGAIALVARQVRKSEVDADGRIVPQYPLGLGGRRNRQPARRVDADRQAIRGFLQRCWHHPNK